jgi:hypothetical protein
MSQAAPEAKHLSPQDAARLTEIARSCKAAARAVVLYPDGHPSVAATLGRIVDWTATGNMPGPMSIMVLPDTLMLDGLAQAKPDPAVKELAGLLHSHLIGQLTIHPGGNAEAWRQFLMLLARAPDGIRSEGGIARVWMTMAGRHVEIREIDYAEVLRERIGGLPAAWQDVVSNCLQGSTMEFDDESLQAFLGITDNMGGLTSLVTSFDSRADASGVSVPQKTAAMIRMLRGIIEAVAKNQPDRLDPMLADMAAAVSQLSPDMIMSLIEQGGGGEDGVNLMNRVVSRMNEGIVGGFVARNVIKDGTPSARLALAFQTLAPDDEQRQRSLEVAHDEVSASHMGRMQGFDAVWEHMTGRLLTSYTDSSYVSASYAAELSNTSSHAVQIEQTSDDPPERLMGWLSTVAPSALRSLDHTMLLDLLRIETNDARWNELVQPMVALLEDLFLVGDFESADALVEVLVAATGPESTAARRQHALVAIDTLAAGPMLYLIIAHLATVDDTQFERVKTISVRFGEVLVRPFAEALSIEERERTRDRLSAILLAFGNVAKRTVERLMNSQNAAVRRTAIQLMREFGGSSALPNLIELLADSEPQVQQEAVQAILNIGIDRAYRVLAEALETGTEGTQGLIMRVVEGVHNEQATPLLVYILRHLPTTRKLLPIHLRTLEALGALHDPNGVEALQEVLYKGDWLTPFRTRALRTGAAAALARTGTPESYDVLNEAVNSGPFLVRRAARIYVGRQPRAVETQQS